MMRAMLSLCVLMLLGINSQQYEEEEYEGGQAPSVKKVKPKVIDKTKAATLITADTFKKYRLDDFYYYEASGKTKGLILTNRLVVTFRDGIGENDRKKYLKQFNEEIAPLAKVRQHRGNIVVDLDISRYQDNWREYIVGKLTQIPLFEEIVLKKEITSVSPVVIIDGREYFLTDTILIKAKNSVTRDLLLYRLNSGSRPLGDFKVDTLTVPTKETRSYRLRVKELNWPPNLLVLANLLSEQPWVEYAQVVFQPLDWSIDARFAVIPGGSPTLGERRLMVLTVTIANPKCELAIDLLPQFGRGNFFPRNYDNPQDFNEIFFNVEEATIKEYYDDNKKIVVVSWPFYVLMPGRYEFSAVNIPYLIKREGEEDFRGKIYITPPGMLVSSISGLSIEPITDIQAMKFYPISRSMLAPASTIIKPTTSWLSVNRRWLGWSAMSGSLLIILMGLFLAYQKCVDFMVAELDRWQRRREIRNDLKLAAKSIKNVDDYLAAEKALRAVMVEFFGWQPNVAYESLRKENTRTSQLVADCLQELRGRCDPHYKPTQTCIKELSSNLIKIAKLAKEGG